MEEANLTTSDLKTLIKMVFLDGETFSMLLEDGKVEGQIGESHMFSVKPMQGFTTLYRIDIRTVDGAPVESYVFHKHTSKIPKGMPRKAMELFRIDSDVLRSEMKGVNAPLPAPRAYRNPSGRSEIDLRRDNPLRLVLRM